MLHGEVVNLAEGNTTKRINNMDQFIVTINEFLGQLIHFGSSGSSNIALALGLI